MEKIIQLVLHDAHQGTEQTSKQGEKRRQEKVRAENLEKEEMEENMIRKWTWEMEAEGWGVLYLAGEALSKNAHQPTQPKNRPSHNQYQNPTYCHRLSARPRRAQSYQT